MGKGLLVVGVVAAGLAAAFYFMGKPKKGDVTPGSPQSPEPSIPTETSENVYLQPAFEEKDLVYDKIPATGLVTEDRSVTYAPETVTTNTATYYIAQEAAPAPAPVPTVNNINPDTNNDSRAATNATVSTVEPTTGVAPPVYREPTHEEQIYTSIRGH